MKTQEILARFAGVKETPSGWMARCPAHDDGTASLSLSEGEKGVILHCHANCSPESIVNKIGLKMADLFKQNGHPQKREIVATYDYRDEEGKLLFQSVRYQPKKFSQRRPDGKGGWTWNLDDCRRVLYRLPELIADQSDGSVFLVEGEKDVENLRALDLVATSNPQGAGKWRKEFNRFLKGRRVVILADNDDAGRKHALQVHDNLQSVCESVVILELPGLPEKGDVSDWFAAGGKKDDLLRLADAAQAGDFLAWLRAFRARVAGISPMPQPHASPAAETSNVDESGAKGEPAVSDSKPEIDIGAINDLPTLVMLSWAAMRLVNDPPYLFQRGGEPLRLEQDDAAYPVARTLTSEKMRYELAHAARWTRYGHDTAPAMSLVNTVLSVPELPLPVLRRIVQVPVFAEDGTLKTDPGYHPASRTFYAPVPGLRCLTVPETPSALDVQTATQTLDTMLQDFPFEAAADRAHAFALFLLTFCREMIAGPTPLHVIEASIARTGKSLLSELLTEPVCGNARTSLTEIEHSEELRKALFMAIYENHPIVRVDNLNHFLNSGVFASYLTDSVASGRPPYGKGNLALPIRCIWIVTGNNVQMSEELAGRAACRVRLVPDTDSPAERQGFAIPDIRRWARENRARLIWAGHTMIRHWIAQGRPAYTGKVIGSYEDWSRVVGGILQAAGVEGFLANYGEFQTTANDEKLAWRAFTEKWFDRFGEEEVLARDLLPLALEIESLGVRGNTDQSQKQSLGKLLKIRNGVISGEFQIVRSGMSDGYMYWHLRKK